jgi:hypothetical protein
VFADCDRQSGPVDKFGDLRAGFFGSRFWCDVAATKTDELASVHYDTSTNKF